MLANTSAFSGYPRSVRPAPDPIGLYFWLGRNDHLEVLNFIASGEAACCGFVFDPTLLKRHQDLREQVLNRRLDAILDPKTQQSATPGGYNNRLGDLPWGVRRPHTPVDFEERSGRRLLAALGDFVLEHGFTQVLAPTHVLRSAHDEWLATDLESTRRLRGHLDRRGSEVPIIYSLAVAYSVLRDPEQRSKLVDALRTAPASAVWLKVDGFGSSSSASAIRTYLEAAADFRELDIPIIADHVGGLIGLSLLAFNATGGLAHGVTLGERFDATHWRKPRSESIFAPQRRVYIPQVDLMLKPAEARMLLGTSSRAKALFGCPDEKCCPRGITDMIENRARHFLYQRTKEVSHLSQIPERLRAQRFLEQNVRPTTDRALAAANIDWQDEVMAKKTRNHRKRLDMLRVALGEYASMSLPRSFAQLPKTRAVRDPSAPRSVLAHKSYTEN
ncbi:MAG: hypothetical protein ACREV1_11065 [Gammaproteobacteria bacterium]